MNSDNNKDLGLTEMASIAFEDTTTVNGVEITTEEGRKVIDGVEVDVNMFTELYKMDRLGRVSWWRIYVHGDKYYRESGIMNGAVKKYDPVQATPKNVGRSNETTPHEQALFEAFSDWKHKQDQLYTPNSPGQVEDNEVGDRLRPMLAETFTTRKQHIKYPCGVSAKLDGVRCMIYTDKEGKTEIISRQGKKYDYLNGIRTEASQVIAENGVVLDGELYTHNIPFNAISGAVRTKNKPSKYDELIEYHIFDLYIPTAKQTPYVERMKLLKEIEASGKFSRLKFVYYTLVSKPEEFPEKHNEFVQAGYEGMIIRNLAGEYKLGRRVNDLLKYKEFEDAEFPVVDVVEGVGSEKGAAIFVCETKNPDKESKEETVTFNVRPRGSVGKRRIQFQNKKEFIGKMLTVRYQPLTKEDKRPRFPVGIKFDAKVEDKVFKNVTAVDIRDYE